MKSYCVQKYPLPGGRKPLLRFLYSEGVAAGYNDDGDVYADLTAYLPSNPNDWQVSIAVTQIGDVPIPAPPTPWNHSKVAVRDYKEAITGGMNWVTDYVEPMADSDPNPPHTHRLNDLSISTWFSFVVRIS